VHTLAGVALVFLASQPEPATEAASERTVDGAVVPA
jgi:hypothetical protein